jgi:FkbM family methyltransferase
MNIISEIELREGWWWPRTDKRCWDYMKSHADVPQLVTNFVPAQERRVVVQAGGNCGFYPKQYSTLFDRVYTFEPDWLNFYCLNLNVPEQNVVKIQSCVGEIHQTVGLQIKKINRGKNFVDGVGIYPMFKIDDLALDQCDLIQLDIEGYEYYSLIGAIDTIRKFSPIIVVEVWEQHDNRFDKNLNQKLNDLLISLNYELITTLYESDRVYKFKK